MKNHPISEAFPLMEQEEFGDLIGAMKQRGFDPKHPVVTFRGMILDGRNRWQAAKQAGIEAKTVEFTGSLEDALRFVIAENVVRRHLSQSQKATVALELEPFFAEAAREKQRAAGDANLKVGPVVARLPQPGSAIKNAVSIPTKPPPSRARDQAAKLTGASGRQVQEVKAIRKASPAAFEAVKAGTLSAAAAKRTIPPPPIRHPSLAYVKDFKAQVNTLHAVIRWCKVTNANVIYGRELNSSRLNGLVRDLENAITVIKFATPYTVCLCGGKEPECRLCRGDGWITEQQKQRIPAKK